MWYNGHGTVRPKDSKQKHEAGKWVCSNNEFIAIEEVLRTIDVNLKSQVKSVAITADCCGGSGAYERLVRLLEDGTLSIRNFREVQIITSSFYW